MGTSRLSGGPRRGRPQQGRTAAPSVWQRLCSTLLGSFLAVWCGGIAALAYPAWANLALIDKSQALLGLALAGAAWVSLGTVEQSRSVWDPGAAVAHATAFCAACAQTAAAVACVWARRLRWPGPLHPQLGWACAMGAAHALRQQASTLQPVAPWTATARLVATPTALTMLLLLPWPMWLERLSNTEARPSGRQPCALPTRRLVRERRWVARLVRLRSGRLKRLRVRRRMALRRERHHGVSSAQGRPALRPLAIGVAVTGQALLSTLQQLGLTPVAEAPRLWACPSSVEDGQVSTATGVSNLLPHGTVVPAPGFRV